MSRGYLPVDRDQIRAQLSIRDSIPADHPVWLLIMVVERVLDLSALARRAKLGGRGRAPFDPKVLAMLLIWGQRVGQPSCEQIALECQTDLAFQAICGDNRPSAGTLAQFRHHMLAQVEDLNVQVLQVLALCGLGDFSLVGVDGVKLAANASKKANRTEKTLRRMLTELDAADAAADAAGAGPNARVLAGRAERRARVQQALDLLVAERESAAAAAAAADAAWLAGHAAGGKGGRAPAGVALPAAEQAYQRALRRRQAIHADWQARNHAAVTAGLKGLNGTAPQVETHRTVRAAQARLHRETARAHTTDPAGAEPPAGRRKTVPVANTTDPDSRLMPVRSGGFIQGYNCQACATRDGIYAAGHTCQDTGDSRQCQPMLTAIAEAVALFTNTRLAAGYRCTCPLAHTPLPAPPGPNPADTAAHHTTRMRAAQAANTCQVHVGLVIIWILLDAGYLSEANITAPGPPRLIATGTHRDQTHTATHTPTTQAPNPDTDPTTQMRNLLRTPDAAAAYHQRGPIAERPFAQLKHNRDTDTLHTRGLPAATAEWTFLRTTHNLDILTNHLTTATDTHITHLAHLLRQARTTLTHQPPPQPHAEAA